MPFTDPFARRVVPLIDLTRLGLPCSEDDVRVLCERAKLFGVAAVCVWPEFAHLAREELKGSSVKISSLLDLRAGFSGGDSAEEGESAQGTAVVDDSGNGGKGDLLEDDSASVESEWRDSDGLSCAFHERVEAGAGLLARDASSSWGESKAREFLRADYVPDAADEVEFLFPWGDYIAGELTQVVAQLARARELCGDARVLKVTLETGLYPSLEVLKAACDLSIESGVDFITASTGKRERGVTPEAVRVLCSASRAVAKHVGIKISGGVRDGEDAQVYIDLVSELMGLGWVEASRFRLGASRLLDAFEEGLY